MKILALIFVVTFSIVTWGQSSAQLLGSLHIEPETNDFDETCLTASHAVKENTQFTWHFGVYYSVSGCTVYAGAEARFECISGEFLDYDFESSEAVIWTQDGKAACETQRVDEADENWGQKIGDPVSAAFRQISGPVATDKSKIPLMRNSLPQALGSLVVQTEQFRLAQKKSAIASHLGSPTTSPSSKKIETPQEGGSVTSFVEGPLKISCFLTSKGGSVQVSSIRLESQAGYDFCSVSPSLFALLQKHNVQVFLDDNPVPVTCLDSRQERSLSKIVWDYRQQSFVVAR